MTFFSLVASKNGLRKKKDPDRVGGGYRKEGGTGVEEFGDKREHFARNARTFRSTAVNFGIVVGIISSTLSLVRWDGSRGLRGGWALPERGVTGKLDDDEVTGLKGG